ncbi:copper homeostasis membrane protein CopD [Hyphomicrobium sp. 99]|uniref:copper homeostasis membrane protein CopD n=1 Tax=Hyphomicrobium sp. 99 TaxID=1163419 RepID=UPI0005F893CB|nr:copper homeostasis membrane protein CopD [Hyphomicrobium sp. 99]
MDTTLIFWRALHFVATIQVAGVLIFRAFILSGRLPASLGYSLRLLFWCSLAVAFLSGVAWFCAVTAAIDDASWVSSIIDGTGSTVLMDTQFGNAWIVRFVAGALLAAVVLLWKANGFFALTIELVLSAIFAGGLAFAGHAASGPGMKGDVHLAADVVHIFAASAWLGGLLPYALYLWAPAEDCRPETIADIAVITRRFSNLGIAAVLTIAASGLINASNLVGSAELLTHSAYGRMLSIKVAIFLVMVMIATLNRFALTPRLSESGTVATLRRNALIEAAFGLLILCVVAALGTMPPALLDHIGMHH